LNFQKWPWWYEEVVGGLYRLERQGSVPNSTVKYGEEHLITPAGEHPITAGISPFHVADETYKGLFISPNIKPLLLTDNPTSDRIVAWIGPCTTSKVVFIQLGHDHSPFRHPSYRAIVHNSVLWTAGKLK
jgi:type 1 glutamine amidotransferase